MDFAYSPKVQELRERVSAFMEAHIYPAEAVFEQQVAEGDRWQPTAIMEELKNKAEEKREEASVIISRPPSEELKDKAEEKREEARVIISRSPSSSNSRTMLMTMMIISLMPIGGPDVKHRTKRPGERKNPISPRCLEATSLAVQARMSRVIVLYTFSLATMCARSSVRQWLRREPVLQGGRGAGLLTFDRRIR